MTTGGGGMIVSDCEALLESKASTTQAVMNFTTPMMKSVIIIDDNIQALGSTVRAA